ncbi:SdpI family protein [Flavobacterium sp. SUN052]|uniref:SdpI family protein n=1 Tax=Flavobacterium sp. SUN052 TaxID=3002441 RepID=UPI00237D7DBD|nr:SdpI family protein [Flavobacterium sp. SUN052]MEC4005958.1 SdpI family protein [Flavobacterium sp. SUN052]
MIPIILILLVFAIILRIFTPKKPNYFFGYQLGSAKKSDEHWKIANRYASNYMIVVYSLILGVSLIFNYIKYDGEILLLTLFGIGIVTMYFYVENKLKRIN